MAPVFSSVMALAVGTLVNNRYEILSQLGQGTFGEVYEARDHHQGQTIAIKLLDPALIGTWPWHEATRLTALRSEFILPILNADFAAGVPFIVTEIVRNGTLADVVARGALIPHMAVSAIRQACRGIARTHDAQILHRDVKLENLFVGDDGRVLVGDFGLAYPLDGTGSAPSAGTPVTMAPEVLAGGMASVASDIYSLGASLYGLLTSMYPYLDTTGNAVDPAVFAEVVAAGPPSSVRDLGPHISRGLHAIVDRAMARAPADRYRSAADFDAALGALRISKRAWETGQFHPGHFRCWRARDQRGRGLDVCVVSRGTRFDLVTTRVPSRRRVRRHCHTNVALRQLPARLRGIFERLGN